MNVVLSIAGVVVKEMYRRKDFYVLFVLTALITLLMGSLNFFNDDKIVRYLKEICLLLIWLSSIVIAIVPVARQIPQEKENRTIFPLLAKPVTRAQLIAGKFLGCWLACGIALLLFYLFFGVVAATREHSFPIFHYIQAVWLHWLALGMIISMSLLGSIIFAAPSSNSTICFVVVSGILLLGRHLNSIATQLESPASSIVYTIYFVLPHLEIFDVRDLIIHSGGLIRWDVWLLATPYALVYMAIFLVSAWLAFRRKPLN